MLRANYTEEERDLFHKMRYGYPDERVMRRLEILWLHSCGKFAPEIAEIVKQNPHTVRDVINMYKKRRRRGDHRDGFEDLPSRQKPSAPSSPLRVAALANTSAQRKRVSPTVRQHQTPAWQMPGFQASIESYNGRWERGVWFRKNFENLRGVQQQSAEYVEAVREKRWERYEISPRRWTIPEAWTLDYSARPKGKVIFIRRSTDQEHVEAMGHQWIVKGAGAHKLVRANVDLTKNEISFFRLRRSDPTVHELLGVAEYHFPKRKFKE